jgi:mono/diheme cytochrome c family protein
MKRIFKWLAIALAAVAGIVLLAAAGMMLATDMRMTKTYTVEPQPLTITADPAVIESGRHLAEVYCTRCHGENLAGGPFFAMENLGYVDAPNLTSGAGGVGAAYSDLDWVRAIRHGVRPNGNPLFIMPSADFQYFSDDDLGLLIAYLESLPAVDNQTRERSFTPLARILYTAGAFGNLLPAERIDHAAANHLTAPPVGPTAEYGAYIVSLSGCRTCHGQDLAGGKDSDPEAPPAPSLARGSALSGWREADFVRLMRQGTTPGGRQVSNFMPWQALGRLSDEELRALWMYLQSLSAHTS